MNSKSNIEIVTPAPVLNIPEFDVAFGGPNGCEIPRNPFGHSRHLEFIALPGQIFTIEEIFSRHHHLIYRVSSPNYSVSDLFLDSLFSLPSSQEAEKTSASLNPNELSVNMKKLLGNRYVWGGNWSSGIQEMLHLYPPQKALDEDTLALWTMKGVDCSGLLYEASRGTTPRNNEALLHFGTALPIAEKSRAQIAELLKPMDMVVWPGHLWFVLDEKCSIESKSPHGVIQRPLSERLEETCNERKAVDEWSQKLDPNQHFVIRRFCSND
jgi:hypothetical protein